MARNAHIWLVLTGLVFGLIASEVGSRIWVAWQWTPEEVEHYTQYTSTRGRYTRDSIVGYRGTPHFRSADNRFTHNDYGFRGPPFDLDKPPNTLRVVILGGSTAYGTQVADHETGAVRLEELLRERASGVNVEVLNAGLPGWTSLETTCISNIACCRSTRTW